MSQTELSERALQMKRRLLLPHAAAEYIGFSHATLAGWRHYGRGPGYLKIGSKIFYEQSVLDAWLDSHRRQSTSEAA
jgi:hypothetical protein